MIPWIELFTIFANILKECLDKNWIQEADIEKMMRHPTSFQKLRLERAIAAKLQIPFNEWPARRDEVMGDYYKEAEEATKDDIELAVLTAKEFDWRF